MSNVVDLFATEKRINAKECIQGRVDELDEDDSFTDALVVTYGADGISLRSNAGGYADIVMLLEMVRQTVVNMHMYGAEDDEE